MKCRNINFALDTDGVINNYASYTYGYSLAKFAKKTDYRDKKTESIIITEPNNYKENHNTNNYKLLVDTRAKDITLSPQDYRIMVATGAFDVIYREKLCNIVIDPKIDNIIKNCTEFDIKNIYDISKLKRDIFWLQYIWPYCISHPPRENAVELIADSKRKGDTLLNLTSRKYVRDMSLMGNIWRRPLFRKMLLDYYVNYGIEFDKIILCREKESPVDKKMACIENDVNLMVDDQTNNAIAISEVVEELLLPDTIYNQDCPDVKNITRIYNLYQAHDFVDAFRENDQDKVQYIKKEIGRERQGYSKRKF